ncbi:hypothetical protein N9L44_05040 [Porticoccaceae bacterium]|nr:hypothetical protein [Porticoccaceae bacterium]
MKSDQPPSDRETFMTLASGRIRCSRCQALSKRTKRQCGAPAVRGMRVCRFHGGKSTGPKTKEGRKRCGTAKTVHGGETRAIRAARPAKMAELKELERLISKY